MICREPLPLVYAASALDACFSMVDDELVLAGWVVFAAWAAMARRTVDLDAVLSRSDTLAASTFRPLELLLAVLICYFDTPLC